jgi:hypothetical protein
MADTFSRPVFGNSGNLGTSGTWQVPSPSESIDERCLGPVEASDKTRQSAFAAIAHARAAATDACAEARAAQVDPALSIPQRHARAAEITARALAPVSDSLSKARKIYEKELGEVRAILAPTVEASEVQIAEVRSKLSGLPQGVRFTRVSQSIDRGSDLLVAAVVSCDAFLSDFLTEPERSVLLEKWQRVRFPEEFARLKTLESDIEHLEGKGRLLENWQRSTHNPNIGARDIYSTRPGARGAPGPIPSNRGAAMNLEQRAAATGAAIARSMAAGR